jgi:glycosyltransferase 2 family protein
MVIDGGNTALRKPFPVAWRKVFLKLGEEMGRSDGKWVWISILISAIILAGVLLLTIDEETFFYLDRLNPAFLLLALVFRAVVLGCWAMRIRLISQGLGYSVRFARILHLVLLSLFAGAITPGQVGSEAVRITELSRSGIKVGDATAVVITERALDAVIFTCITLVTVILLGQMLGSFSPILLAVFFVILALTISLIVLLLFMVRNPHHLKRLVSYILTWLQRIVAKYNRWKSICPPEEREHSLVKRVEQGIDDFHMSIVRLTDTRRRELFGALSFTALLYTFDFAIASLVLMGLGQPPFLVESYLFQLIIHTLIGIPLTPGAAGVAEISAASLYGLIIPASILGVFVIVYRIIFYYLNILLGIFASLFIFKRWIFTKSDEIDA